MWPFWLNIYKIKLCPKELLRRQYCLQGFTEHTAITWTFKQITLFLFCFFYFAYLSCWWGWKSWSLSASAFENDRESWTGSNVTWSPLKESHIRLSKRMGYFSVHPHLTVGPALNLNARFCSSQHCHHCCPLLDIAGILLHLSLYSEVTDDLLHYPIYRYRMTLCRLSPYWYSGILCKVHTKKEKK